MRHIIIFEFLLKKMIRNLKELSNDEFELWHMKRDNKSCIINILAPHQLMLTQIDQIYGTILQRESNLIERDLYKWSVSLISGNIEQIH